LVDSIIMPGRGRSLFDASRIPAVERFRHAVAEAFPTEKGVWTPLLESVYEQFVDSIGGKGAAAQLDTVLRSVRECEVEVDEPDPRCTRLRAKLEGQAVLFACMNEDMGGEQATRHVRARLGLAVRAWEQSPFS
jgi:hypothetical protein